MLIALHLAVNYTVHYTLQLCSTSARLSLQVEAYLLKCQMTAECTTATTRRTITNVTATTTTAEVDVL